jgi:hypothetical protein
MGIFKDFATSGYGDVTIGALHTLADNPEVFGILPQGNLNVKQVADATVGKIFANNRSIFEQKDFNDVQRLFAYELAKAGPEGVMIDNPYVPSANLFEEEKNKHAARLSEISKMPKADKLLMNIDKAVGEVPKAEAVTDLQIKGASITAKGFGLLNTYPDDAAGRDLLQVTQLMIINANAKALHPDDLEANRSESTRLPITDIIANFGTYKKTLSDETIAFVNQFVPYFKADGQMIEPQRNFFPEGDQGDKLYSRFLTIFNNLYPEMDLATLGGYGMIESPPKRPKKEKKSFIETKDLPQKKDKKEDK